MIVICVEQGSPEWHAYRCGKVTASRVADVIAKTKTGWGALRANYAAELVAERLTGQPAASFTSTAMQWGTDTEPQARAVYEVMTGLAVEQVGLVQHPTIAASCASPDGLVGPDGLVEIKCPNTATHIETLLSEAIPAKYITQMQWQMACAGRAWCDFVSFDPRMPGEMQLFVKRVPADAVMQAELAEAVSQFDGEVSRTVAQLTAKYGLKTAAE